METELPSLPPDEALSEADCILHCAADRNFRDGYSALRPINVDAAKALAKISARTGADLHVLSSGAVAAYEGDDDSYEKSLPRPSPRDGYVATKWVMERYLGRISRHTGVPITAHRPTQTPTYSSLKDTECEAAVTQDMMMISRCLGSRPDFTNLSGTIDVARLQEVAEAVASSVVASPRRTGGSHTMTVVDHPGSERISIDALASHTETLLQHEENRSIASLPTKSALFWAGDAKRAGLFEWFFTAQEVTMWDINGNQVVTKR